MWRNDAWQSPQLLTREIEHADSEFVYPRACKDGHNALHAVWVAQVYTPSETHFVDTRIWYSFLSSEAYVPNTAQLPVGLSPTRSLMNSNLTITSDTSATISAGYSVVQCQASRSPFSSWPLVAGIGSALLALALGSVIQRRLGKK